MANEIQHGDVSGRNLSYAAYPPDGQSVRTAKTSLTESQTGYYRADDASVLPGDFIIITDDDLSDIEVGYGVYGLSRAEGDTVESAGYLGDYVEDGKVYFLWRSSVTFSTAGTIRVYKEDGTVEVTSPTGITDTRDFDSVTGVHLCIIDLNANSFYAREKDYCVMLNGAVIGGQTIHAVIATFSIEKREVGREFRKTCN